MASAPRTKSTRSSNLRRDIRAMIDENWFARHRERALSPDHPVLRGSAQNPDVFFQGREAVNPYYLACPTIVQNAMDHFATLDRPRIPALRIRGAPDAERVIIAHGLRRRSCRGNRRAPERAREKLGLLKVRLYRPFAANASWLRCRRRCKSSPCSTAPRSRARWASHCTRT